MFFLSFLGIIHFPMHVSIDVGVLFEQKQNNKRSLRKKGGIVPASALANDISL